MINLGMNLNIVAATILLNEDQNERVMIKHGWTKNRQAVGIKNGAFVMYGLHQGLQSVRDDIELIEDYRPLEGDVTALWDVYNLS